MPKKQNTLKGEAHDVLNKGQYLGKKLLEFIKNKYISERFMIYIDHPPLSEIKNQSCYALIKDINKYTLPYVNQNVFRCNGKHIKSFDSLHLSVYSHQIVFHFVSIGLDLHR